MSDSLKRLRNRLKLTQSDVAARLGLSQQTIARWESGVSPIPSKYLKDLAILFGGRVSDFVGGEPSLGKKVVPIRKVLESERRDDDIPYGTVVVRFGCGNTSGKPTEYLYPVTHGERNRLITQIETLGGPGGEPEPWLEFETLDQRWVLVNTAHLDGVTLLSEASEQLPDYEHIEVYKAARDIVFQDLPGKGSPSDDDFPISANLMDSAKSLIAQVGGEDAAMSRLAGLIYEFASGERQRSVPEDEVIASLVETFKDHLADSPANRMIDLDSEGYHQSRYVKLGSIRLIELSRFRLTEVQERTGPV